MSESERDRQYFLAERLGKMIQCATVSRKEEYDDTEFAKLRAVMKELFPLVHARAEIRIFGDDCWLYKIEGRKKDKNMILMSHHDVAPVSGEWKHPGFSGEIAEGRIWGRGTVDTKTPLFAEFQALEEILSEGGELPCNVYLASSHNEEIAGDGMPKVVEYFKKIQVVPDLILDEGGAVIDPPMPGITKKCAVLAVHEKGRCVLKLRASEGAEHGGLSGNTETPAVRMARLIVRLRENPPYIRKFSPELCAMFSGLAPHMKFPLSFIFSHLRMFAGILIRVIPKLNAQAGAMLGTTGTVQNLVTEKEDGTPVCRAELSLSYLDETDLKTEIERIASIASEYGITVQDTESEREACHPAAMDAKEYRYIRKCVGKVFPDAISIPFILPAGTDARHFCGICRHVYRFAPIDIDDAQFKSVHGVDENISLDAIPKAVGFYKLVVRNYRTGENRHGSVMRQTGEKR